MKNILVILSLFLALQVHAQIQTRVFGDISDEEIEMTSYEKDPEAKAVVLFDKGKSVFYEAYTGGFNIRFTRHKRIKFFKNSDSELSEIIIPFYVDRSGSTETVKDIEATTYNMVNGELVSKKLNPKLIYKEQMSERYFIKKFVFPDVQDGSIIEYKYTLETPFAFNLPDWEFQDVIPTLQSEYQVNMIPFYEYVFLAQGISSFDYYFQSKGDKLRNYQIKFQDLIHTYGMIDVPAFKNESYISSPDDYIIKMDFQLAKVTRTDGTKKDIISTWPVLNQKLLKANGFGLFIKGSARFAEKILKEELDLTGLEDAERAKKVIEYVKDNFEWNGRNSNIAAQSAKDFFKTKIGNAAGINLFLIALLRAADIEVEPVILSTRSHGKIQVDYPFAHFTNYVIVLVKTNTLFLTDGTETLLPFNRIPIRCLNEKGLIVNKEKTEKWISLQTNFSSLEKNILTLDLDPETLNLNTQISIQSTEYDAYSTRREFENDTAEIKVYYEDQIGNINRTKSINYNKETLLPYNLYMIGEFETEKLANKIIFQPFLNLPLAENKLTQKERTYPIDFIYPWNKEFLSILKIPENCSLPKLPETYSESNELMEINLNYILTGNILKVEGNYKFKKSMYEANDYTQIKEYIDEIVRRFNEPIIIEVDQ